MEITEEQIKELHEFAYSGMKQKIEEWFPECFKQKLEINKWYKYTNKGSSGYGFCFIINNAQKNDNVIGYGFNTKGKWIDNFFSYSYHEYIPATTEEVESMLIKEAEKRGFKKGVNFIGVIENSYGIKDHVLNTEIYFDSDKEGGLYASKGWIMADGKWATIVEKPKEMTLEEIEKQLGHKVKIVS